MLSFGPTLYSYIVLTSCSHLKINKSPLKLIYLEVAKRVDLQSSHPKKRKSVNYVRCWMLPRLIAINSQYIQTSNRYVVQLKRIQADLGDITGPVSDHHNKVNIAIK